METILEPGETPMRTAEGSAGDARSRFARSADGAPVLATPRQAPGGGADEAGSPSSTRSKHWLARTASEKWLEGQETPRPASVETLLVSILKRMWRAYPLQTMQSSYMHCLLCLCTCYRAHVPAHSLIIHIRVSVQRGR